jgi:hypothetical protein
VPEPDWVMLVPVDSPKDLPSSSSSFLSRIRFGRLTLTLLLIPLGTILLVMIGFFVWYFLLHCRCNHHDAVSMDRVLSDAKTMNSSQYHDKYGSKKIRVYGRLNGSEIIRFSGGTTAKAFTFGSKKEGLVFLSPSDANKVEAGQCVCIDGTAETFPYEVDCVILIMSARLVSDTK